MLEWIWWVPVALLLAAGTMLAYLNGHRDGRKEATVEYGAKIAALQEQQKHVQWEIEHMEKALEGIRKAPAAKEDPKPAEWPRPEIYRWR